MGTKRAPKARADDVLVGALAGGSTYEQAGQTAGMSRQTVIRRMADPAFRARVTGARSEVVNASVGALVTASTAAVAKLVTLLEAESQSVQLATARAILELGCKMREADELEAQIRALEERLTQLEERRGYPTRIA